MTTQLDTSAPSFRLWHTLLARGVSEDEATELMNGYAHELAERQRDERPQYNPDWQAWGDAANLIDPLKGAT